MSPADLGNPGASQTFAWSVKRFAEKMGPAVRMTGMPEVSDLRGAFETYLGAHPPLEAGDTVLQGAKLASDVLEPRPIPEERILITERGVVAFKGAEDEGGNTQLIPFRLPPWAVKDLLGQGKIAVSVAAGGKLNLGTGTLDAEKEFPGFLLKFILQSQSHLILFEDEIDGARDVLKFSYLGQAYHIKKETLAELYPDGADVPDLDAEFKQLASAAFPLDGEQGIWNLISMKRGGEVTHDRWRIKHVAESTWHIFEDGDYVGDIDLKKYPMPMTEKYI